MQEETNRKKGGKRIGASRLFHSFLFWFPPPPNTKRLADLPAVQVRYNRRSRSHPSQCWCGGGAVVTPVVVMWWLVVVIAVDDRVLVVVHLMPARGIKLLPSIRQPPKRAPRLLLIPPLRRARGRRRHKRDAGRTTIRRGVRDG